MPIIVQIFIKMRLFCAVVLWCLYSGLQADSAHTEDPIVETKYGTVQGSLKYSRAGRQFFSFTGIPYAKPPVGDLRFRSPQRLEPWKGIYNAQKESPHCIQVNYLFANPHVEGQEDCLYLNVYSPKLRARRAIESRLLPVMVFIHWGGFFTGYATGDYLGPEYFMDENVILVTFNYRLAVMGFLSTNDDTAPGNYGLKDQVAVLKWVQENIENFGGNKDSVTLFGQSAGAACVHFHLLSPQSRKLFHRGISQSGTALAVWAQPNAEAQNSLTKMQAKLVGCKDNVTNAEIVDCLRKIDAADLVESSKKFKVFSVDPLSVYVPAIEKLTQKNPDAFITKPIDQYIRNREYMDIPWIVGVVEQEGLVRAEALLRPSKLRADLNARFDELMPLLMGLKQSVPEENVTKLWTELKQYYFKGNNEISIDERHEIEGLINIYTDRFFLYSSRQSVLLQKYYNYSSIWVYKFNYRGHNSYGDVFAATNETIPYPWGVSHCDDLLYLFQTPALFPSGLNKAETELSKCLIQSWTHFAYFGHPNIECANWDKTDNFEDNNDKSLKYLSIEGDATTQFEMTMKQSPHDDRMTFWESLPVYENFKELNQTTVN